MNSIIKFFLFITIIMLIFGCSSKVYTSHEPKSGIEQKKASLPAPVNYTSNQIGIKILNEFKLWEGTPHKMGGYSKEGIDCSGFTHYIFTKLFSLNVPRSTKMFLQAGIEIKKSQLQPGDLVLFQPHSYPRHVGIYVGNNEFIHVSKSKGVIMSGLNNPYWKKHYKMSRRIIYPHKSIV